MPAKRTRLPAVTIDTIAAFASFEARQLVLDRTGS